MVAIQGNPSADLNAMLAGQKAGGCRSCGGGPGVGGDSPVDALLSMVREAVEKALGEGGGGDRGRAGHGGGNGGGQGGDTKARGGERGGAGDGGTDAGDGAESGAKAAGADAPDRSGAARQGGGEGGGEGGGAKRDHAGGHEKDRPEAEKRARDSNEGRGGEESRAERSNGGAAADRAERPAAGGAGATGARAIPDELETMIQMLMMMLGGENASEQDKGKIMDFMKEMLDTAEQSGNEEFAEGLRQTMGAGLDMLRGDRDVSSADVAKLEEIIDAGGSGAPDNDGTEALRQRAMMAAVMMGMSGLNAGGGA